MDLMAFITSGASAMEIMPVSSKAVDHISIIGPNAPATFSVPFALECKKSTIAMTIAASTINVFGKGFQSRVSVQRLLLHSGY